MSAQLNEQDLKTVRLFKDICMISSERSGALTPANLHAFILGDDENSNKAYRSMMKELHPDKSQIFFENTRFDIKKGDDKQKIKKENEIEQLKKEKNEIEQYRVAFGIMLTGYKDLKKQYDKTKQMPANPAESEALLHSVMIFRSLQTALFQEEENRNQEEKSKQERSEAPVPQKIQVDSFKDKEAPLDLTPQEKAWIQAEMQKQQEAEAAIAAVNKDAQFAREVLEKEKAEAAAIKARQANQSEADAAMARKLQEQLSKEEQLPQKERERIAAEKKAAIENARLEAKKAQEIQEKRDLEYAKRLEQEEHVKDYKKNIPIIEEVNDASEDEIEEVPFHVQNIYNKKPGK